MPSYFLYALCFLWGAALGAAFGYILGASEAGRPTTARTASVSGRKTGVSFTVGPTIEVSEAPMEWPPEPITFETYQSILLKERSSRPVN